MSPPASPRRKVRVLVVDDNASMAEMVADGLADHGYEAIPCGSGREALRRIAEERFDALVTDLRMPDVAGLELLAASKETAPDRPVIVMTAHGAVDSAIESIRRGAFHYLTKPFKVAELALFLGRAFDDAEVRREATALRRTLREHYSPSALLGTSEAMRAVREMALRVADSDVPLLLTGETGTGKSLLARAVHTSSGRSAGPFVTVNCAALPENLLESELFGHVRGAFTGATANRAGLFAEARGGTIFLDEIGDLPRSLQAKLLDVLERGVVRAVGSNKEIAVDARVIAATHRDLRERVEAGELRRDLLYRLDVVSLEVPSLRHRRDDIPLLAEHFLARARERHRRSPVVRLSPPVLARLRAHPWPGNVRELEHLVERLVVLGREEEVRETELPSSMETTAAAGMTEFVGPVLPVREVQRRYASWALEQLGGRKQLTAEKLGVDGKTLAKWLTLDPTDR